MMDLPQPEIDPVKAEIKYEKFRTIAQYLGIWPLIEAESASHFGVSNPDKLDYQQKYQIADAYEQVIEEITRRAGLLPWERNS